MRKGSWLTLLIILLIAAVPRFYNNKWDDYHALHPDERFLAMVSNDTALPQSIGEYLDPNRSPLNPYNVKNARGGKQFPSFVYGTLPITITKFVASAVGEAHYTGYMKVGRALSAVADLIVIACWFIIVTVLSRRHAWPSVIAPLSALLYAFSPLAIQLSHFFATDTFLNAACAASLLAALYARTTGRWLWFALCGAALGCAFACKISALYFAPLAGLVACLPYPISTSKADVIKAVRHLLPRGVVITATAFITLRLGDPHIFGSSSLLNPSLSATYLGNIRELMALSKYSEWPWPPSVQWLSSTRVVSPFYNIFWFGVGPVCSLLALVGLFSRAVRHCSVLWAIVTWGVLFFVYQGSQFAHTMRYFIMLYPVITLLAAHGFTVFSDRRATLLRHLSSWALLAIALLTWPLAFMSNYTQPHSRVEASRWILDNVPAGSTIATEHWDDGLPLSVDNRGRPYSFTELAVFGMDTDEKWSNLSRQLQSADYIVLSSNRTYGSMCKIRKQYPRICSWYDSLFAGTGDWIKVHEVYRKPTVSLGPITISWDTQKAEEAFSVYDHPRVMVFKRKMPR